MLGGWRKISGRYWAITADRFAEPAPAGGEKRGQLTGIANPGTVSIVRPGRLNAEPGNGLGSVIKVSRREREREERNVREGDNQIAKNITIGLAKESNPLAPSLADASKVNAKNQRQDNKNTLDSQIYFFCPITDRHFEGHYPNSNNNKNKRGGELGEEFK